MRTQGLPAIALALIVLCNQAALAADPPPPCIATIGPSANLQKAIDQVASQGRGSVCLQAGVYNLVRGVVVRNEVVVRGIGATRADVLVQRSGSSQDAVFSTDAGTSGSEVRDLTINGGGVATYGVLLYRSRWNTLSNLSIDNVSAISVGMVGTYHVYFFDSYLGAGLGADLGVSPHIWITDANAIWVANSTLVGKARTSVREGDGGIAMYGTTVVQVYNNNMTRGGVYLASSNGVPTSSVNIWGNTFNYGNEWPVDIVEGSHDVFVSSNTMTNAFYGAMVIWNANAVEVSWNQMFNNNRSGYVACQGINLKQSTNLNIHDNSVSPLPVTCVGR